MTNFHNSLVSDDLTGKGGSSVPLLDGIGKRGDAGENGTISNRSVLGD